MGLRKAVDLKCKECIYDPIGGPGSWRQQVEACTSYKCPLFDKRPRPESKPVESTSKERSSILGSKNGQIQVILDQLRAGL